MMLSQKHLMSMPDQQHSSTGFMDGYSSPVRPRNSHGIDVIDPMAAQGSGGCEYSHSFAIELAT